MSIRRDDNKGSCGGVGYAGIVMIIGALLAFEARDAFASEESVDQLTHTALALDADGGRGALQFTQYCVRCHGSKGYGDSNHEIPALAGQRFAYLVRQLANLSEGQRESDTAHRVLSTEALRDPQSWADIAAYLHDAPARYHAKTGDGTKLALGEGIFHLQCASCHHDDAGGDDDGFVPSLRNQHYSYLVKQLGRLSEYDRHNVPENLVRFLRSFDSDEVSAVADYLSRLRGPGRERRTNSNSGAVIE
jgi:cytochrome c553